ncbi:MAG: hypothetical protein HC877_20545 [Thioploca sp.]|nr:hypothetical protein [Thioploca sp.]
MKYDITLKTLLQKAPRRLLQMLVNSQPQEILTVEYPSVKDRRPDLVVRLTDGRLYHLELQTANDITMPQRMLDYPLAGRGYKPRLALSLVQVLSLVIIFWYFCYT